MHLSLQGMVHPAMRLNSALILAELGFDIGVKCFFLLVLALILRLICSYRTDVCMPLRGQKQVINVGLYNLSILQCKTVIHSRAMLEWAGFKTPCMRETRVS